MSSLQMTLPDSEATIAGKTHSEILLMPRSTRSHWYRMISPKDRAEAMKTVEIVRRAKNSAANMGENNPNFGKAHTEEHKAKISASLAGKPLTKEHMVNISAATKEQWKDPEFRNKMTGENHPRFNNWASREPYCHLWDEPLRESIRNHDNRTCVLCGKGEIQNGRRLSVHHIDGDKRQGCGKRWYLCALCISCNSRPDTVEKEFLIIANQSQIRGRI